MGSQGRFNLIGIIVITTYIVIPMIGSTAVGTYKNTLSQDIIFGTHLEVCCDIVDVSFIHGFVELIYIYSLI